MNSDARSTLTALQEAAIEAAALLRQQAGLYRYQEPHAGTLRAAADQLTEATRETTRTATEAGPTLSEAAIATALAETRLIRNKAGQIRSRPETEAATAADARTIYDAAGRISDAMRAANKAGQAAEQEAAGPKLNATAMAAAEAARRLIERAGLVPAPSLDDEPAQEDAQEDRQPILYHFETTPPAFTEVAIGTRPATPPAPIMAEFYAEVIAATRKGARDAAGHDTSLVDALTAAAATDAAAHLCELIRRDVREMADELAAGPAELEPAPEPAEVGHTTIANDVDQIWPALRAHIDKEPAPDPSPDGLTIKGRPYQRPGQATAEPAPDPAPGNTPASIRGNLHVNAEYIRNTLHRIAREAGTLEERAAGALGQAIRINDLAGLIIAGSDAGSETHRLATLIQEAAGRITQEAPAQQEQEPDA